MSAHSQTFYSGVGDGMHQIIGGCTCVANSLAETKDLRQHCSAGPLSEGATPSYLTGMVLDLACCDDAVVFPLE